MKTYYQANGWVKFSEEDIYKDGCQPNSSQFSDGNINWKDESLPDLIKQLLAFTGADNGALDFDSCDEIGRLDISCLEDIEGNHATESQIKAWKAGVIRLWSCIYSFQIEQIITTPVKLLGEL